MCLDPGVQSELESNGRISILLVADDVLVRNFLNTVLAGDGYLVRSAADSSEALKLNATFGGRLHLLLSCLPAAEGIQLAQRIIEECPETRALVASPSMRSSFAELAGPAILMDCPKPPAALVEAITRSLSDQQKGTYVVIDPKL